MKLSLQSTENRSLLIKDGTQFEMQLWHGKTDNNIPVVVAVAFIEIMNPKDMEAFESDVLATKGDTRRWHVIAPVKG